MSAVAALVAAFALAGCGSTTYFAGRTLPPSGISNRVLVAIQNPSSLSKGALQIMDAYYDTRYEYSNTSKTFTISGYSGGLPSSIQNLPEQEMGVVYGSSDGSLYKINYAKETSSGTVSGLSGLYPSVYMTRNGNYVFGASQANHVLTVVDNTGSSTASYSLSLPGIYRVSVNTGGSVALAFVQNSNYVYYPRKLSSAEILAYAGGSSKWPKSAVDCEPVNSPAWCLFQMQSPDNVDPNSLSVLNGSLTNPNTSYPTMYYGEPLTFDRPTKAVFSNDGGTAYILSCGPECGGTASSISAVAIAPLIYLTGQSSGKLPTTSELSAATLAIQGGASNALVNSTTMYVVGQQKMSDGYWGGQLTVVALPSSGTTFKSDALKSQTAISDGLPGYSSRMILADDDTLWIAMQKCNQGERANNPSTYGTDYGCLTMFNTSSNSVTAIEPYLGDATGIAAVTTLHKVYAAIGGQVYIYSTTTGNAIDNQYVTVTGTAYDVAYMDATDDSNNTVY